MFTALDLTSPSTDITWAYRNKSTGLTPARHTTRFFSDGTKYELQGNSTLLGIGTPVTISYLPPAIPPGATRQFDTWNINAPESNAGGTVIANQIRVGVTSAGSFTQSSGFTNTTGLTVGTTANLAGSWTQSGGNTIAGAVVVGAGGNATLAHSGGSTRHARHFAFQRSQAAPADLKCPAMHSSPSPARRKSQKSPADRSPRSGGQTNFFRWHRTHQRRHSSPAAPSPRSRSRTHFRGFCRPVRRIAFSRQLRDVGRRRSTQPPNV